MDRQNNPLSRFLKRLGPGLIAGASDDDPSGIGTYTQAGASLGYATLWTAIVTLPLMIRPVSERIHRPELRLATQRSGRRS